ncbi:MAG: RNA polymerase sigma factor [Planctomycetes bacterium]|nr:RNA polymerase sigma factor [Planctomycetota bacterium]
MSDRELLSAYADRRDMVCLGTFFSRHESPLLRFASSLLGDAEAAQDVVQETFLAVLRRPRRLLAAHSCRNWLLKVTRNTGIDHLRREIRHRRKVEGLAQETDGKAPEHASRDPDAVEVQDERARVRRAIQALPPHYREVLLLKIEHDKSYQEIAEITGLTVPNVGYRLHEAMKALTKKLSSK